MPKKGNNTWWDDVDDERGESVTLASSAQPEVSFLHFCHFCGFYIDFISISSASSWPPVMVVVADACPSPFEALHS